MAASFPLLLLLLGLCSSVAAVTTNNRAEASLTYENSAQVPINVTLPPASGNIIVTGLTNTTAGVDSFYGIPFAQPPVGNLRLRPPQPLNYSSTSLPSEVSATTTPVAACPQFYPKATQPPSSPPYTGQQGEDCLKLTIHRPTGLSTSTSLPVMVWTYGGAFIKGYSSEHDGANIVEHSVLIGLPIVHVEMNYRVGALGFLPGRAIKEDGAGNVGLLDQRMALQWVSDNVEAFGGDPSRVTIWGQSAGAMSTFDQMLMNDGNMLYKGKSLFRGAIMDSGTVVPVALIDGPKGQELYDSVVNNTVGCSNVTSDADQLDCLRSISLDEFVEAADDIPSTEGVPYAPLVDGTVLTASPEVLASQGTYVQIPFITGDQEDEGTLFVPSNNDVSTPQLLAQYFAGNLYRYSNFSTIQQFVDIYQRNSTYYYGSPYRTPDDDPSGRFPAETKRAAAIFGDVMFTLMRRILLLARSDGVGANGLNTSPCWSYIATYDYLRGPLGTQHASDLTQIFNSTPPDAAAMSTWEYYLSFVYYLDPNARGNFPYWPPYDPINRTLLNISRTEVGLFMKDDFREDAYQFLVDNIESFYL